MIFVVDDEPIYLELLRDALEAEGYSVRVFDSALPALEALDQEKPEAIFSDIRMPEMDGFTFKEEVDRLFPAALRPPFIFLSSLDQPAHLIRGLDLGAEDYLTKPIDPGVLRAKLRSLLKRKSREYRGSVFKGDLSRFPFIKIIQFCENEGFTGSVLFEGAGIRAELSFKAGNPLLEEWDDADDVLSRLYELDEGSFTIMPGRIDFSAVEEAGTVIEESTDEPAELELDQVMGRLSGLKLLGRLFQIQTEVNLFPEPKIATIVMLDGNLIHTKENPLEKNLGPGDVQQKVDEQHTGVEEEIRKKAEKLLERKAETGETEKKDFYRLFEKGLDAYQNREFRQALEYWESAEKLRPDDPTLKVNLRIVRAKI